MVIYLERGADLHMAQLMPLRLLSLASVKSRLVLPFWYWLSQAVPEKGPLNVCVCVCVLRSKNIFMALLRGAIAPNAPHGSVTDWDFSQSK